MLAYVFSSLVLEQLYIRKRNGMKLYHEHIIIFVKELKDQQQQQPRNE